MGEHLTTDEARTMYVWKMIDDLPLAPTMSRAYYGFAGAQGGAVAIKSERGIIVDSSEGVVVTNVDDAARYMTGEIPFGQIRQQREFVLTIEGEREARAWVESDRFVVPCKCEPRFSETTQSIRITGEDDCPIHGFDNSEADNE